MAMNIVAVAVAGLICGMVGDDPIPVKLDGFDRFSGFQSSDGTFPVRWNQISYPWIEDAASCRSLWQSRSLIEEREEEDWTGLRLSLSFDDKHPLLVKTCAEWAAGLESGRYAMTTYDMREQSRFIFLDGVLSAIACAVPARQDAISPVNLHAIARLLLPPPVDRDSISRTNGADLKWHIQGNSIHREDEMFFEWIEPVVFGDIDGDGWQDMVALYGSGATQGSMRGYDINAFTRIGDGPLTEISLRVPQCMPSVTERQQQVASWHANCGIPVDREIEFHGTCDCRDADHGLSIRLTANRGILSGDYRCEHKPTWVAVRGCMTNSHIMLQEFGMDDASTASLHFNYRLTGGVLFIDGWRCGSGHMETDSIRAEAAVADLAERDVQEDCSSAVEFRIESSTVTIRRSCEVELGKVRRDVLCVGVGAAEIELVRMDRIEWGTSTRKPEADPCSDAELAKMMPRSVFQVDAGGKVALFDGWMYGGSTKTPSVIAIPIRDGILASDEVRVFRSASIVIDSGVASVHVPDLQTSVDQGRAEFPRPDVIWRWAGKGWVPVR